MIHSSTQMKRIFQISFNYKKTVPASDWCQITYDKPYFFHFFSPKIPGFSILGHWTGHISKLTLKMAILASLTCPAKCLRLTKVAN